MLSEMLSVLESLPLEPEISKAGTRPPRGAAEAPGVPRPEIQKARNAGLLRERLKGLFDS
jgi:hypothetical protein